MIPKVTILSVEGSTHYCAMQRGDNFRALRTAWKELICWNLIPGPIIKYRGKTPLPTRITAMRRIPIGLMLIVGLAATVAGTKGDSLPRTRYPKDIVPMVNTPQGWLSILDSDRSALAYQEIHDAILNSEPVEASVDAVLGKLQSNDVYVQLACAKIFKSLAERELPEEMSAAAEERFSQALTSYIGNQYRDMIEVIAEEIFGSQGMDRILLRHWIARLNQGTNLDWEWHRWQSGSYVKHRLANGPEGLEVLEEMLPAHWTVSIIGDGVVPSLAKAINHDHAVAEVLELKERASVTEKRIASIVKSPDCTLGPCDDEVEKALQTLSLRLWARRAPPEKIEQALVGTDKWKDLPEGERHVLARIWATRAEPAFVDIVFGAIQDGTVKTEQLLPALRYVDEDRFNDLYQRVVTWSLRRGEQQDPSLVQWTKILFERIRSKASRPRSVDVLDVNAAVWLEKSTVGTPPLALLTHLYETREDLRERLGAMIAEQLQGGDRVDFWFRIHAGDVSARKEIYSKLNDPRDIAAAFLLERARGDQGVAQKLRRRLKKLAPFEADGTGKGGLVKRFSGSISIDDPVICDPNHVYLRIGDSFLKITSYCKPGGYLRNAPQTANGRIFLGMMTSHAGQRSGVFCLDAVTGKTLWHCPLGGIGGSNVLIHDDRVFACADATEHCELGSHKSHGDGGLYCLDLMDGQILWYFPSGGSPQWKDDHLIAGKYQLDGETGRLLAVLPEQPVPSTKKTIRRGNYSYVLHHHRSGDRVFCIDTRKNEILWEESASVFDGNTNRFLPVTVIGDLLFVGSNCLRLEPTVRE